MTMKGPQLRTFALAALALLGARFSHAQALDWVGNTSLTAAVPGSPNSTFGGLPRRGGYLSSGQQLTVVAETFPISAGQTVNVVYTTNNWITTTTLPMGFLQNVGNNTRWRVQVPTLSPGTEVQFYIQATSTGGNVRFDNNNAGNFGAVYRFTPKQRRGAILQWFATDYATMIRRLPEVVQAGYSALWLPPPQKSVGGGFSVGYNPFDRFDLGDRLQFGTVRTRYGTAQELQDLIKVAHRFGLEVYADLVLNHNANRAESPIDGYPGMIPEDFHIFGTSNTVNNEVNFNGDTSPFSNNLLNNDLVGLTDLAQEDGNAVAGTNLSLPSWASFGPGGKPRFMRQPECAQYYPSLRTREDDIRAYLRRWGWWLTLGIGFDGYRLDAIRHITPSFFGQYTDQRGPTDSASNWITYMNTLKPGMNIFGEDFTTDGYELREFAKTGMNMLDFNLKSQIDNIFNSNGFGSLSTFANGYGIDSNTGLSYQNGGLAEDVGVSFVQSHDRAQPVSNNLAHALTLTRPGQTIVYYDGNNLDPNNFNQFPKPGRFDALGAGGDTVLRLVDARARFGRGSIFNRWVEDNIYIYERHVNGQATMLVGLNIRGDLTSLTRTVDTAFVAGQVLEDLTGQQPNVTVGSDRKVTITVPPNSTSGNNNNARGFVVYVPKTAAPRAGVEPVTLRNATTNQDLVLANTVTPGGIYAGGGSYRVATLDGGRLSVQVETDSLGATAFISIDNGAFLPGLNNLFNTPEGLTDGFLPMTSSGAGSFSISNLDLSNLDDGLHMVRVRVFNASSADRPPLYREYVRFLQLNRTGISAVNGDLQKYGAANVFQLRNPSSNSNRIDALYVRNDEANLYIGLAGNVDVSEGLTNGMVLWLDTKTGTGMSQLEVLADDSGPATRLLSNALVTAPPNFLATHGLAVFRRTAHSASPGTGVTGSPAVPYFCGAAAGLFEINPNRINILRGLPCSIAWKPRVNRSDAAAGLEAAIPLRTLYPNGSPNLGSLSMFGYLCSTGEAGTVLRRNDPLRVQGNRPRAVSWISNQWIPTQSTVVNDPGQTSVTASSAYTFNLSYAAAPPSGVDLTVNAPSGAGSAWNQTVTITNNSASRVEGPFYVRVDLGGPLLRLTNATGFSTLQPFTGYVKVSAGLDAGASTTVTLNYNWLSSGTPSPSVSLLVGSGIL
jgi:alpha-amylase